MGIARYFIALAVFSQPAVADYLCEGKAPDWTLQIKDDSAEFSYFDRSSEMDIPQISIAEGSDWPRAMTLIGPRDSAIVVLHERACGADPFEAQVLTQRGQSPILLSGCCAFQDAP